MARIRSDRPIYKALEKHLQTIPEPLTAPELYEFPEVQVHAADANDVSDYLGHMWRRGLLSRYPAPPRGASMARWAYKWKEEPTPTAEPTAAGSQRVTLEVGGLKITIIVEPK